MAPDVGNGIAGGGGIAGGTLPRVDAQREELASILPPLAERIRVTFIRDALQAWHGVTDQDLNAPPGVALSVPKRTARQCRLDIVIALSFWTSMTHFWIATTAGLPSRSAVACQLWKWRKRSDANQLRDLQRIAGVFLFVYGHCFGQQKNHGGAEGTEKTADSPGLGRDLEQKGGWDG